VALSLANPLLRLPWPSPCLLPPAKAETEAGASEADSQDTRGSMRRCPVPEGKINFFAWDSKRKLLKANKSKKKVEYIFTQIYT